MADILRLLTLTFQTHEMIADFPFMQAITLTRIAMWPGIRQCELAERLSMQPIKLSRIIDQLEAAGLVERRKPAHDHRVRRLYVLPEAQNVLERINVAVDDIWHPVWQGIDCQDINSFRRVLSAMHQNLIANNTRFPQ
ncbi:MarR family winged helix-turn-helix transcriptional regulator [Shewanella sp.]|uniref:MarR family winged helix-turn-helix transcriptional regulator n=1 Tax=Shewanella sp. TaxID=50422 RepID=UPI003A988476